MVDIYFWRQFFILSALLLSAATSGFMLGFPAVLIPAITAPNSTDIRTTSDHASWISAINGVGGIVGCFIVPPIMHIFGRKESHYTLCMCFVIGWAIFPFAKDITALYVARFIQGLSISGLYINGFTISEYVHPCRRGYFVTLKAVMTNAAVLCCHAMSAVWTWRQIAVFAGGFAILALLLTYFWPESPSHLALKGKFAECEKTFIWLHGNSEESQKLLKSLIEAQRDKTVPNNNLMELRNKFLRKNFQKPLLLSFVLSLSIDMCGRYYYSAYIIQMMKELIGNKTSALYFTVGADFMTLIAVCTSTVVIKYVKRRTILFASGASSVGLMLLISVLVYFKSIFTFPTFAVWLTALIIILQSFIGNFGIVPISYAITTEIFPMEHIGLGSFASCFMFTFLYSIVLKIAPILIEHTKLYGTYGIFGLVLAMCLMVLYKTVPETKDKTLQEIEYELNGIPNTEMVVIEREKLMH